VAFTKEVVALAFDFRSKIVKPKQKIVGGKVIVEESPVPHLNKLLQDGFV